MNKKVEGPHEDLTYRIIGAAMAVHSRLGPGHKEDVYQRALEAQSVEDGLAFEAQKLLEVHDNGLLVGYYIPDFIYEEKVVVEIKAFSSLSRRYLGQVVTYLNHTGLQVGLLLNFGERRLIPRRVFPSTQAAEFRVQYPWLFIPDWLRAERAAHPPALSVASVPSVSGSVASVPSVPGSVASVPSVSGSVASVPSVSGSVIERLIAAPRLNGTVTDVRIGTHWTAVVVETPLGPRAGLAATQLIHDLEHGRPAVRDAGRLIGRDGWELVALARSDSLTERSIGFAALNALLEVDETACVNMNAEEIILEKVMHVPGTCEVPGTSSKRVAIVGHFPFVPRVREVAATCWVLELNPTPGDLPAEKAPEVIPQADVVAITGMTLVNGTFEALAALPRRGAFVLVLGPSTPLSPVLFDYGVDAISGTVITEIAPALAAVSQGANFRQIPGKRLLTMMR
ncbi:MAG: GxxExxY protein [Chloroflexi bacterium]|nr:GxxExxY protein [Chloroflexota bacterium]